MLKKNEQHCSIGLKNTRRRRMFLDPMKHVMRVLIFERLRKHYTNRVSLGNPNKG